MDERHQPMKYWFASDFHFGHRKVLDYCSRPFTDMDHQDQVLVETWNSFVKPQDVVFVLGDFSFYEAKKTTNILRSLIGQKTLIKGNHDKNSRLKDVLGWSRVLTYHEQRIEEDHIILSHFPFMSWNRMHRGSYHLHGHSHGSMRYPGDLAQSRILDVGIDHTNARVGLYRPLEWSEIKDSLSGRRFGFSTDHHEVRE